LPEKAKLGFVGCGFMGQCVHLPSFHKVKNAEIVAVSDLRPKLAKAVAERWGIKKVYPSHLEMIEDKEIDAVVEVTNKSVHAPIAIDALECGKHVFTEKPMATSSEDAKKMVLTARKHGLKLMVGYMKRYDTGVLRAKEAFTELSDSDQVTFARSHVFGGDWICGVTAEIMIDTAEPLPKINSRRPSFSTERYVNIMDSLFEQIHDVNLPRYFLGDPAAVDSSMLWPGGFVSLLDYGEFPLVLETGSITADFWEEQLIIYFRNGWIDLRPAPPLLRNTPAEVQVYLAGRAQREERLHGMWSWAFERQAQHFIDCIVEDKEPISNGADSYKDIVIVESIIRAASEGRRIEIRSMV